LTLTVVELFLGIDSIIFVALLSACATPEPPVPMPNHQPEQDRSPVKAPTHD
jgi:hypothetical protein